MKKFFAIILCLLMLTSYLNISCHASAVSEGPVDDWSITEKTITVNGTGEDVSIFLLNPGKTVSDLNSVDSIAGFNEVVNYTNVLNFGISGAYSHTFTIRTNGESDTYLLYVKDKNGEFSAEVNYGDVQIKRFYVSFDAVSGGDGSRERPFSTIEAARDHIRTITKTMPIEVIVSGGIYKPAEDIEFTSADSGTADYPVTYKAAEGQEVIFSGAKEIDIVNTVKRVDDGNILGRVSSEAAKHLVEIDLTANSIPSNIADYLANHSKGHVGHTTGIYLNDERQSVSRWPNTGYGNITNVHYDGNGDLSFKIQEADSARMSRWSTAANAYLEGYFASDWYGEWVKLSHTDPDTQTIYTAEPSQYKMENPNLGRRVAVVNLLEEIDVPGEWYIDSSAMKLYYYPPHTLTIDDTLEICTLEQNIITVYGGEYLNFEGFTFEKTAHKDVYTGNLPLNGGNGILLRETHSVSVRDCTFRNIGMDAVYVVNSDRVNVDSCTIYDVGLRGIYVKNGGNISTLEESHITISDCYISDAVRDAGQNNYAGITIDNSVAVTIENNTICNMKNSGIRYGGNLHIIKNNEIYNCVTDTSDAGAIYAGRSFVQYGTVIKNNYLHTVGAGIASEGAGAVFWDDKHSGNAFVGNIVDTSAISNTAGIRIAGGTDNLIEGNIFIGTEAIRGADRDITNYSSYYNGNEFVTFKNATTLSNDENVLDITDDDWLDAYKTKFSGIMNNYDRLISGQYKRIETIKDNVMTGELVLGTNMQADSTISNNKTVSDMDIFVDAEGGDYRLTNEYVASLTNESDKLLTEDYTETIGLEREFVPSVTQRSFGLVYPFNNSQVYGDTVTLKWNKCNFANSYIYEISDKADFSTTIASGETYTNTVDITGLDKNTKYYWRVTGVNNSRYLDYTVECSDVFSFTLNEEVYLTSLSFDKSRHTISMDLINDGVTDKTVCFVVALKDSLGNLIDAKTVENYSITSNPCMVDTSFVKSGDIIELYILDSIANISPITIKYKFEI